MLWSFLRPRDLAFTITTSFVDGNSSVLANGRPGATARFPWESGAQTTDTVVTITGTWGQGISPRLIGLMNTTLPPGTLVTTKYRLAGGSTFTYLTSSQRVIQKPRGERVCFIAHEDGASDVDGAQWIIANDVNGSSSIVAESLQDIGELWVGPGLDLQMNADWNDREDDASMQVNSDRWQGHRQQRTVRRVTTITPALVTEAAQYAASLGNGYDLDSLLAALDRRQLSVLVPRYRASGGSIDTAMLNRTARLGTLDRAEAFKHVSGPFYQCGAWEHAEIPVPV